MDYGQSAAQYTYILAGQVATVNVPNNIKGTLSDSTYTSALYSSNLLVRCLETK